MMLFLILAPFGTFAALMLIASQLVSLFGASAVAIGTIGYDIARENPSRRWRPARPSCLQRSEHIWRWRMEVSTAGASASR